jgi:hypothetical protein
MRTLAGAPNVRHESPVWSPDGEWIAFTSNRSGQFAIYKMRTDSSAVTQVTYPERGVDHLRPQWAGDSIVFLVNKPFPAGIHTEHRDRSFAYYRQQQVAKLDDGGVTIYEAPYHILDVVWDGTRLAAVGVDLSKPLLSDTGTSIYYQHEVDLLISTTCCTFDTTRNTDYTAIMNMTWLDDRLIMLADNDLVMFPLEQKRFYRMYYEAAYSRFSPPGDARLGHIDDWILVSDAVTSSSHYHGGLFRIGEDAVVMHRLTDSPNAIMAPDATYYDRGWRGERLLLLAFILITSPGWGLLRRQHATNQ